MKKVFMLAALAAAMMVNAEVTYLSNADIKDTNKAEDVNGVITLTDPSGKGGVQTGSTTIESLTGMKLSSSRAFNIAYSEKVTINSVTAYVVSNKDVISNVLSGDGKTTYDTAPAKGSAPKAIDIKGKADIRFSEQSNVVIKVDYTDNNTDPVLKFSADEVELVASAFDKNPSVKVTLIGKNLKNPSTYPLNFAPTEGISVSPTNIEVKADGTVNQEITISYAATYPVAGNVMPISVDVLDAQAELQVNYSNTGAEIPATVSTTTVWDWTKVSKSAEIKLTADTKPAKGDTILLADYPGIERGTFESRALYVSGEYLVRDGKFFQGGYIMFEVSAKGTVEVEFSNTGDSNGCRFLKVNGVKTATGSKTSKSNATSEKIAVEEGQVVLQWDQYTDETGATLAQKEGQDLVNQYARVYKITFTEGDPTAVENAEAEVKAIKVVENGQLVIIKNGVRYNALGARL